MRRSSLILLTALAGCATSPAEQQRTTAAESRTQDRLAAEFVGLSPGAPSSCLPEPARTQLTSEVYGSTIVYRASRNVKYRNDTSGGCGDGGGRDDILVTQTPSTRVCRGDIVRTVDRVSGFETGSCALGDFVPYKRR